MTQPNPPAAFRKQVFALLGERYSDKTLVLCPTVFVRLLRGDHKAAILLSQILYWSDKTRDKDGWFYKRYEDWTLETGLSETQVRRIINGDARVKTPQITLRDLGVETLLRKVKRTGAPTLHYRINKAQFIAALNAFLDPQQCAGSTPDNADDEKPAMPAINPDQSTPSLIPHETPSPEGSTEDHPSDQGEEDLSIFHAFQDRFGKLKAGHVETFRNELARLGPDQTFLVLERCSTRGRSWRYVEKALAHEMTPEVPAQTVTGERYGGSAAFTSKKASDAQDAAKQTLQPVLERLEQPLTSTGASVLEVWQSAYQQMELQLDPANFITYLRDAVLVDFISASNRFVVAVKNGSIRDRLEQRLSRTILRILSDGVGQPVTVSFVIAADWEGQGVLSA